MHYLNLYTVTSVCTFSLLLPGHFLGSDKENLFNNQDIYSQDFNVWVKGDLSGKIRC